MLRLALIAVLAVSTGLLACSDDGGSSNGKSSAPVDAGYDAGSDTTAADTGASPDTAVDDTGRAGGCGGESAAGRCDGDTLVYCESQASGVVRREQCLADRECGVAPDGTAECRIAGSSGCGQVTYEGYCDGDVAVWCDPDETQIKRYDCGDDAKTCGWIDDEWGYWCSRPTSSTGAYAVSGRFLYEKPAVTTDGLGSVTPVPVRHALVQVRAAADDTIVGSNYTDADGRYTVGYDAGADVYVVISALANTDRYAIAVRDCPLENCGGSGAVYGARTEAFAPAETTDLGTKTVARDGVAGAFNIFDVFVRGFDFAWANLASKPPALVAQWAPGSDTSCGTSCYSSWDGHTIFVTALPDDTDEFDDSVLGHEFGHFLEEAYSRTDSPGGDHDGSPTDPRLAWGEGYGTWVGATIFATPIYVDTRASGASVTDISDTGIRADPGGGLRQLISEDLIAEILWTISAGGDTTTAFGNERVFDVLGGYFPTGALVDRGVDGVDLVDFLDGWFCRGHANRDAIDEVVVTDAGFPYDYHGPADCR